MKEGWLTANWPCPWPNGVKLKPTLDSRYKRPSIFSDLTFAYAVDPWTIPGLYCMSLNFACFSMVNSSAGHNRWLVDSSDVEPWLTRVTGEFSSVQRATCIYTLITPWFSLQGGDSDTGSPLASRVEILCPGVTWEVDSCPTGVMWALAEKTQ